MKCFAQISIAALALGAVWIGASSHAVAQGPGVGSQNVPIYSVENQDIRSALRELFRGVRVSYSLAPEVQGVVTVELKNVTFDTALQNILRQVDATYRIEGGVYEIVKRDDIVTPRYRINDDQTSFGLPLRPQAPGPAATMMSDGKYLFILRGDELYKVSKDTLDVVRTGSLRRPPVPSRTR